ncbi:MAG: DUF58 domain-containing protein [Calditerrivibrio sp.]|nr:DUF58 domain-containing protein [Calditerrivibrio sp.]
MSGIRFTRAGWLYIILTVFMGFSAINTNNNLVFIVVSFMLAVMGISGFVGKNNIHRLSFKIYPVGDIFANKDGEFTLEIYNNKKFLPSVALKLFILNTQKDIFFISPASSSRSFVNIKFNKRGLHKLESIMIESPYPFNFFVRYKYYKIDSEITVFPEPANILVSTDNYNIIGDSNDSSKKTMKLEELSNIRSYSNDPAKRIFWKQFAKTGELYTKEYTGEDSRSFQIVFEDLIKYYPLEESLSLATKMVEEFYKNGVVFSLVLKGETYFVRSNADRRTVLKMLALYENKTDH